MPATGCYIYGLIRASEDHSFGLFGLEHQGEPGPVFTIRLDTIAAVVSDYNAREKVLPLRKNLAPHNRVIREVMKSTTIIPMTFGHVAKSRASVLTMLQRNRTRIDGELQRVDGAVEMCLKVKWDVDNIFEFFLSIDPQLAAFRDELFGRSHAPSQADKIELGSMFEQSLNREREEQIEHLVEAFRSCSREVKINTPRDEKMIMDLAFLVDRAALERFEQRVYEVAGTFPAQYVFDYSGPWAPFNFIELDLQLKAA